MDARSLAAPLRRGGGLAGKPGWLLLLALLAGLLAAAALAVPGGAGWSAREAAELDAARGLTTGPGSRGAPFPYPLLLAPALALGGARAAVLLNALLVALAAVVAARQLASGLDDRGPLLVAVALFGSAAFLPALALGPEALLLAAAAGAFALVRGAEPRVGGAIPEVYGGAGGRFGGVAARWVAVGILLAIPALAHPLYLLLVLPALAARPPGGRLLAASCLLAGLALLCGTAAAVERGRSGEWSPWPEGRLASERAAVAGPAGGGGGADLAVRRAPGLAPALAGWNLLYCLAGRHVGLLACFLPLALLVACRRRGEPGATLLWAVGLVVLGFVLLRPFDFAGGATAGNRWFLPLYGALWLLPERGPRPGWSLAALAAAALFVWPLWLAPRAALADGASESWPSALARRVLPYETTQRRLPAAAEWSEGELWLRSLGPEIERAGERLRLAADRTGRLMIAVPGPDRALALEFGPRASTELEVEGGRLTETVYRPDGGLGFRVELGEPRARHRMWFTGPPREVHLIGLRMTAVRDRVVELRLLDGGRVDDGG